MPRGLQRDEKLLEQERRTPAGRRRRRGILSRSKQGERSEDRAAGGSSDGWCHENLSPAIIEEARSSRPRSWTSFRISGLLASNRRRPPALIS